MGSRYRAIWRLLPLTFCLTISCAAHDSSGPFYFLTPTGDFSPITDLSSLPTPQFVPWPRQIRVTDVMPFQDRFFLAVNGQGLAELTIKRGTVSILKHYEGGYFAGRTTARLIPCGQRLFCHLYHDTDFTEAAEGPAPTTYGGLLEVLINKDAIEFTSVPALIPPGAAWEAVLVRVRDSETLAIEWKRTEMEENAFQYSSFHPNTGTLNKRDREWFFRNTDEDEIPAEIEHPLLSKVMSAISRKLMEETPDCVIFFELFNPTAAREKNFVFSSTGDPKREASIYHTVVLRQSDMELLALLPGGRFMEAWTTAQEDEWREGRLPSLPPGYRYTGLARMKNFLCATWEQTDFFMVGRAGIAINFLPM